MANVYNDLLTKINKEQIYLNEPMKKHTTFKIGGPADIFVKVKTIQELKYVIDVAKKENAPVTVIGNGSNILVKDGGIRGIVVKPEFKEIEFIDEETIRVGAGVLLSKIANVAYEHELTGLEFAEGIPGTMGGAVRMNAGAYGKEIKSVIYSTTYIDKNSEVKIANKLEHEFDYRKSRFAKNKDEIIVESIIKLEKGNKAEIKQKMDDDKKSRKLKQPLQYPNAGSVFKRGNDYITSMLIDKCGLKGYNVGDAYVSDLHAGFIINKQNATAKEVLELIEYIKKKVYKEFNKKIELEIEVLGED